MKPVATRRKASNDSPKRRPRFQYRYPRPLLAVDCVVYGFDGHGLTTLLVQRDQEPYSGRWALPGGFVQIDESLDAAARRTLQDETGVAISYLEQLHTFGEVERDPRERVVTVAYFALVRSADHTAKTGARSRAAAWFDEPDLPPTAFDHERILAFARERLVDKVRRQPIGFDLLPAKFTLSRLQRLYEAILRRPLDKRNFRKKLAAMELLEELDEHEPDVARRPARLHRFRRERYERLTQRGFVFEL